MTEVKDSFEVIVNALDKSYCQGLEHAIKIIEKAIRTEDTRLYLTKEDLAINDALLTVRDKIKQLIVKQ
jgi:4-hydroxy-3-methylbut-2-enyl diphosphate reductase IspH